MMDVYILIGALALGIIALYFWVQYINFVWMMMENDWKVERQENKELELLLNTPIDWREIQ